MSRPLNIILETPFELGTR